MLQDLDLDRHSSVLKEKVVSARNIVMWFLVETRGEPDHPATERHYGVKSLYFNPRDADRELDENRGSVPRVRGAFFMVTPICVLELRTSNNSLFVQHRNTRMTSGSYPKFNSSSVEQPFHNWNIPKGWRQTNTQLTLEDFVVSFSSTSGRSDFNGLASRIGRDFQLGIVIGDSERFFPVVASSDMVVEDLSSWQTRPGKSDHPIHRNLNSFFHRSLGCHDAFFAAQIINELIG
ncbi:hypothetical protein ACT3UA_11025 [Glutamicibacter sp. 363]|uniref:hypothetical protein n=1 Tax=unclassified Glutamicibacter TaxID=2627139 RepID=UPI001142A564|nr:hypothetical protein [Glutamicibacter sp. BW80]